MSAFSLVFGILEQDRLKWRGLRMDDDVRQAAVLTFKRLREMSRSPFLGLRPSWLPKWLDACSGLTALLDKEKPHA